MKKSRLRTEYPQDAMKLQKMWSNFKWISGILFTVTLIVFVALTLSEKEGMNVVETDYNLPMYLFIGTCGYVIARASMLISHTNKLEDKYSQLEVKG